MGNFYIKKSNLTTLEGVLFLKDNTGHCHLLESVNKSLESEIFRNLTEFVPTASMHGGEQWQRLCS